VLNELYLSAGERHFLFDRFHGLFRVFGLLAGLFWAMLALERGFERDRRKIGRIYLTP
jgi:hypothetical protein